MKKLLLFFLVSFVLFFCFLSITWALSITTVGEGHTRQSAINNALRSAVEEGLGALLQSETRVVDGSIDYDRIISASAGYIRNYDIIAEGKDPLEGNYKVKVRVELDDFKLKDLLKEFKQDPRFQKAFQKATFDQRRVVILYEPSTSQSLPYKSMAVGGVISLVEDKLVGYGFRVFHQEELHRIKHSTLLTADDKTANIIRMQKDSDAVVIVDVHAGKKRTSDGYWIIYTTLALKAKDVTTGEIFANVTRRAKSLSRSGEYGIEDGAARAVSKAGNKAADIIVDKIVKRFSTKRQKFVFFIFKNVSEKTQDSIYGIFQDLGWDFRVARQAGPHMEIEVFTEYDPTSANMTFRIIAKKAVLNLYQVEMKGSRITYSGD